MLQTTGKIKQLPKWGKVGMGVGWADGGVEGGEKQKLGKHGTQNLSLKMCLKQSQCCAKSKHKEFVHMGFKPRCDRQLFTVTQKKTNSKR